MKVGFIGLGKMGSQMVLRLLKDGHQVVVRDVDETAVTSMVSHGAVRSSDRRDLVRQLSPVIVWLMIPADFVDPEIDALLPLLPSGSIVIDGGNSDYRQTLARAKRCQQHQVQLVDVGTSGGLLGLQQGFSMTIGGAPEAVQAVEPIIKSLAQPGGYQHFGPTGAGHYIKMVHNAIEYGAMEAYAEGYRLLQEGPFANLDLAGIGQTWQHGSIIESRLGAMMAQALHDNPDLGGIDGYVADSGEATWALQVAKQQTIDMPVVEAAVRVRHDSQQGHVNFATKLLAITRHAFGGHAVNKK